MTVPRPLREPAPGHSPDPGPATAPRAPRWRRRPRWPRILTRLRPGSAGAVATLVAGAVLGAGAGLMLPTLVPYGERATASVLVRPLEGNPYSPSNQGSDLINLETEAQVAGSDVVLADVQRRLDDGTSRDSLADGLQVSVGPNTQVVDIAFRDEQAARAEQIATLFAEAYLDHRAGQRDAVIGARLTALDERITSLTARLSDLRAGGREPRDPEVRAIGGQLLNLRLQEAATTATDSGPGQLLVDARARAYGRHLPAGLTTAVGLVLGLAAALGVLALRSRREVRVRGVEDLEELGLPVLAEDRADLEPPDRDGAVARPSFAAGIVARAVRRRATDPHTVAVAALGTGSAGRAARDLAAALARPEETTLLVDAQGRPGPEAGLAEVLLGERPLRVALDTEGEFAVLGPGRAPERAAGLVATSRMTQLLDEAADLSDWVVVTAPGSGTRNGRSAIGSCHHWIPVVVADRTTAREVARALAWAEATGVVVLGCVLVTPHGTRASEAVAAARHG